MIFRSWQTISPRSTAKNVTAKSSGYLPKPKLGYSVTNGPAMFVSWKTQLSARWCWVQLTISCRKICPKHLEGQAAATTIPARYHESRYPDKDTDHLAPWTRQRVATPICQDLVLSKITFTIARNLNLRDQ